MRVMVFVKASQSSEAGELPSVELMNAMGNFNQQLVDAGVMKAGDGLKPSREGVRVRFRGDQRLVTNGPFAETTELVAGYWIWEVASLEDAVEWVKRCPNPMPDESDIEIRPFYEISDFAQLDPDGTMAAEEVAMQQQMDLQSATLDPYLFFGGRCEEALEFYKTAVHAKVEMVMRFSENPDPIPPGLLQPGFENKVMHASMKIGPIRVMCSDGCNDATGFEGFRLALSLPSVEACRRCFENLSEGGKIDMPLTKTFWSPLYGQLTDRFGVPWMVMTEAQGAPS